MSPLHARTHTHMHTCICLLHTFCRVLSLICFYVLLVSKEPTAEDPLIIVKVRQGSTDQVSLDSAMLHRYDQDGINIGTQITIGYFYRPRWISCMSTKYMPPDYVHVGWQEDDLPIFAQIKHVAVVMGKALLCVSEYETYGFDHHYHSYLIQRMSRELSVYWLTELVHHQPLTAHVIKNGSLCITLRSHVEKM